MSKSYTDRPATIRISHDSDFGKNLLLGPSASLHTMAALQLDGFPTGKRPGGLAPIDWGLAPINPPIKIIPPEFAVQLKDLRVDGECPGQAQRDKIAEVVRQGAAASMASPWIRAICDTPGGLNPVVSVGLWPYDAFDDQVVEGRMKGLRAVDLLDEDGGDFFGMMITKSLIGRTMAGVWNNMPKRLNHAGQADESGPIHLTGLDVRLENPDAMKLVITGHDSSAFPDISFTVTYTDRFSINGSAMVLVESDSDLETDTGWHVVLGTISVLLPLPLSNLIAAAFLGQAIYAESVDAPAPDSSLGAILATAFLRDHVLLPPDPDFSDGIRLNLSYTRMNVVNAGIFTGGTYIPTPREPSVTIEGPTQIAADANAAFVSKPYRLTTVDLQTEPSIVWSGDAGFSDVGSRAPAVTFDLTGVPKNVVVMRQIRVDVTDSDGVQASATVEVEVHRADFSDPQVPGICRVKPWLPQCR